MPSVRPGAEDALSCALNSRADVRALVRTTAGLEQLAADELRGAGYRIIHVSRRQVVAAIGSPSVIRKPPRLADDLFIIAADAPDPGRTKADLRTFAGDLAAAVRMPVPIRPGEPFAVSGSFVGSRSFTRFALEDAVGDVVQRATGGAYVSRADGTAVPPTQRADLRIVLDGSRAILGVRPFSAPLHRRDWRTRTVPGSLHPPVAAAVARLAAIRPGDLVLDPFCGAGTVLLEAAGVQPSARYIGIDRDAAALTAARENAAARPGIDWRHGDAGRLAQFAGTADRIVTNPPWGLRQAIDDIGPYFDEWRVALKPDGLAVAIITDEQAAVLRSKREWRLIGELEVVVAGTRVRIVSATPASYRR